MNETGGECGQDGAVKNKNLSTPNAVLSRCTCAAAEMPGDGWSCKRALFTRQGMRPHAELHQQQITLNSLVLPAVVGVKL